MNSYILSYLDLNTYFSYKSTFVKKLCYLSLFLILYYRLTKAPAAATPNPAIKPGTIYFLKNDGYYDTYSSGLSNTF